LDDSRNRWKRNSIHTNHDQPLWLLNTVGIGLGISQALDLNLLCLLDLFGCSVADKDWLSTPFDDDLETSESVCDSFSAICNDPMGWYTYVLALGDGCKVNLDLGHSQNIG